MKSFAVLSFAAMVASVSSNALPAVPEFLAVPTVFHADEPFNVTITKVELEGEHADSIEKRHLEARQGSCSWQAFTGDTCNGAAGAITDVPSTGRCNDARGRHSYFISSGCPTLRITINDQVNCGGTAVTVVQGRGCYNVNTGRNWQSSFVSRA